MFIESQPTDKHTHETAMRMAREFTEVVSGILMAHERQECLKQAYLVARRGLDAYMDGETRK
jgi:hypothetical protein